MEKIVGSSRRTETGIIAPSYYGNVTKTIAGATPNGSGGYNGSVTQNSYDDEGKLTKTIDPDGGVTSYTYDEFGNQTSLTDPDGNTTTWQYNADNQVTLQTSPNVSSVF